MTWGGSYALPTGHNDLWAEVQWWYTQSIENNTSEITAKVYIVRQASWMTTYDAYSPTLTINIDGTDHNVTANYDLRNYPVDQLLELGSYTKTIGHTTDGSRSFGIYTIFNTSVSNLGSLEKYEWLTLPSIPRASSLTSGQDMTLGFDTNFIISRASTSFTHIIDIWINNQWIKNIGSVATSSSSSFSAANQGTIAQIFASNGFPSTLPTKVQVTTYNGSTEIGWKQYTGNMSRPQSSTVSPSNFNIGSAFPFTINRQTTSTYLSHSVLIKFNAFTKTIANTTLTNAASDSQSVTFSAGENTSIYATIPNANSGTGTVTITSYINGVQCAPTSVTGFIAYVINSNPTVSAGAVTYIDNTKSAVTGDSSFIIQNMSELKVTIPAALMTSKNGATMTKYEIYVAGESSGEITYSASQIVFSLGTIDATSNQVLTVTGTDSRGNSSSKQINVKVVPYSPPVITALIKRDNGFDAPTTITGTGTNSLVTVNSVNKNAIVTLQYRHKLTSAGTFGSYVTLPKTLGTGTFTIISTTFSLLTTAASDVEVYVTDTVGGTFTYKAVIESGRPIMFMDVDKNSVSTSGFPKYNDSFEVTGSIYKNDIKQESNIQSIADGVDLNTVIGNGTYRLGGSHPNLPSASYGYGQMIVGSGGGDTIMQIIFPYTGIKVAWRSGNPSQVGGAGTYGAWKYMYDSVNKPTTSDIGAAKALTLLNGYNGLTHNDGTTSELMRTTLSGLIPYASGGASSSLGTATWPFKDVYATNIYSTGGNKLVDYGSNANGKYVKFANGTVIAWKTLTYYNASGFTTNSTLDWNIGTLPITLSDYQVQASANFYDGYGWYGSFRAVIGKAYGWKGNIWIQAGGSGAVNLYVDCFIIGKV